VDRPDDTLGVVRAVEDPNGTRAEFAIIVRSDLKGRGLGRLLLEKMIHYARGRGIGELVGQVMSENRRMQQLAHELGFEVVFDRDLGAMRVRLSLA
jgi:L-amino acid N-acyltransferase YncA